MKFVFLTVLWLSPVLNAALYWYRKQIDKQRQAGTALKAGVQLHKVVLSGSKHWLWWRHFWEDFLFKAFFPVSAWLILKDFPDWPFFVIPLALPLLGLFCKVGLVLNYYPPFVWPLFFGGRKGRWTFYCCTLHIPRLLVLIVLGCLAAAALFTGIADLLPTPSILLYVIVIAVVAGMVANIFYLLWKITPVLSGHYVEYDGGILRLISRITKREIAHIDFQQSYAYEEAYDERSIDQHSGAFLAFGGRRLDAYIFAQGHHAIAITESLCGAEDATPRARARSMIWDAKLPGEVSVTYVVTPEECGKTFQEIINKFRHK